MKNNLRSNLLMALLASFTLGLTPFFPEPHIVGKLRWIKGGGKGMQLMDYADLLMHGLPWLLLAYFLFKYVKSNFVNKNNRNMNIKELLKEENVKIIDVRETYEYSSDHIPGSVNFPLSQFANYLPKLKEMQGPIILYCRSGARSGQAVAFLKAQGVNNAFNGGGLYEMEGYTSILN